MPSKPEAKVGRHMLPGLAAAALFTVMATVFFRIDFPAEYTDAVGFSGSVTEGIGYALFDLGGVVEDNIASDGFLAAFGIIGVVLVAALVGAVMLARRDENISGVATVVADGGRRPTDQRPTDQRPTDQRPTDQRPTDQRPTDQRPTDQRPTDRPDSGDGGED